MVRNRVKRRLREIVRQASIRPGYDVVMIARPSAAGSTYHALEEALAGLLQRAQLHQE